MNDFLIIIILCLLGLALLYWKLNKTSEALALWQNKNVEKELDPDSYEYSIEAHRVLKKDQLVIHINPHKGENLPAAGIGHNGGSNIKT